MPHINDPRPYRLVMAQPDLDQVIGDLLIDPNLFAWGQFTYNYTGERRDLLVQSLVTTNEVPDGSELDPRYDWILLHAPTQDSPDAEEMVSHSRLREYQTMVLCQLGMGDNREGWLAAVAQPNQVSQIEQLMLVGPGMTRLVAAIPADTVPSPKRFSRLIGAVGQSTWDKVHDSSVMLIGAGRNGSLMAHMLAAVGIKRLYIVDMDRLQEENLDAMFAVTEDDIGDFKARAIQQMVHEFRSDCAVSSLTHSVNHTATVRCARHCDLIVTCVDDDMPRLAAATLANRMLKLHLDVGTLVRHSAIEDRVTIERTADVRLMVPHDACVCCTPGLSQPEKARRELHTSHRLLPKYLPPNWNQDRAGSLVTLNAMTVGLGVQSWIDFLAGDAHGSTWHRLRLPPGEGPQVDSAVVTRTRDCDICHPA